MNYRNRWVLLPAVALLLGMFAQPAFAKTKISVAQANDPIFEASLWPIMAGKIKSDIVDIDVSLTTINAVIQSIPVKQYDVIATSANSVPIFVNRGVPLKIFSTMMRYKADGTASRLWVAQNSKAKTVADLKGKTIGVYGLSSAGTLNARTVLSKVYGFNAAIEGGDFRWVELPLAVLPGAAASGRIDAAVLVNFQDYAAEKSTDLRPIVSLHKGMMDAIKVAQPANVMVAYSDRLAANPDIYKEVARMMRASIQYVKENPDEVFAAIAKKGNADPDYMKWWLNNYADISYAIAPDDAKGFMATWGASKELGVIQSYPSADSLIWEHASKE